jgi:hypothetical protein
MPTTSIRFLQNVILSLTTSKRYLCFIRLLLAAMVFFVISSERSSDGNLELPQRFILSLAEGSFSYCQSLINIQCDEGVGEYGNSITC